MFFSLFFSSNGVFYDFGKRNSNRAVIVLLFIVCSAFLVMLFVKSQKNFYKPVSIHGVTTVSSAFILLVQLSAGALWPFYFPLLVLLSFRADKKKTLAGFFLIAFSEISSSVFSGSLQKSSGDYNPLSIRLVQVFCLFATLEVFHRIFIIRKPAVRKKISEGAFIPPLDNINHSKKIISRNVSNSLNIIFSNPKVRTAVLLFLENSFEGAVFRIFDLRSSAADFIDNSREIKYSGSLLSIAIREPKYYLSRNFNRPAFNLGYYTDDVAVKSFCASAVKIGEEPVGLLCVDSDFPEAFSEEDASDLHRHSLILSDLLQISAYLDRKEMTSTFLQIINDLADKLVHSIYFKDVTDIFLDKLRETFSFDDFLIVLSDKYGSVIYTKSLNNLFFSDRTGDDFSLSPRSIARLVINKSMNLVESNFQKNTSVSRFILHPEDGSANILSFIAVPVPSKDEPCGAVFLMSGYLNNYEKKELELLEVFSRLFGAAISRAKLFEEKEKLALRDGLTGLYNHRHFQELMDEEISRSRRTSASLSLLIMDIDYFKKINDTYGHRTGDEVLSGISAYLQNSVRKFDSVSRYGGEEIAVILPDCPYKEAVIISEKLRQGIDDMKWNDGTEGFFSVTVSVGVSSFPLRAQTKEDLIEDADSSLYSAKESGRNSTAYAGKIYRIDIN